MVKRRDKDNRPADVRKQTPAKRGQKCICGHRGGHYATPHMGPTGHGLCSKCGPTKCKKFRILP